MSRHSPDLLEPRDGAPALPEHPVAALDQVCTNRKPDLAGADEAYRLHPSTPDLRPVDAACSACSLSPRQERGEGAIEFAAPSSINLGHELGIEPSVSRPRAH